MMVLRKEAWVSPLFVLMTHIYTSPRSLLFIESLPHFHISTCHGRKLQKIVNCHVDIF